MFLPQEPQRVPQELQQEPQRELRELQQEPQELQVQRSAVCSQMLYNPYFLPNMPCDEGFRKRHRKRLPLLL
jgi:hypothetical protein